MQLDTAIPDLSITLVSPSNVPFSLLQYEQHAHDNDPRHPSFSDSSITNSIINKEVETPDDHEDMNHASAQNLRSNKKKEKENNQRPDIPYLLMKCLIP